MSTFTDRAEAGKLLAQKLSDQQKNVSIILGLARGGVVISHAISTFFHVPHDVLILKKIPSPGNAEFAIGALAPDGVNYIDHKTAQIMGADEPYIRTQITELNDQINKKILQYRKGRKPLSVRDQSVMIVDDGSATGATMFAAVMWAKKKHARRIIVALPVAPPDVVYKLKTMADEAVVLETPREFSAVGQFYKDFPQLTDEDVVELLQ